MGAASGCPDSYATARAVIRRSMRAIPANRPALSVTRIGSKRSPSFLVMHRVRIWSTGVSRFALTPSVTTPSAAASAVTTHTGRRVTLSSNTTWCSRGSLQNAWTALATLCTVPAGSTIPRRLIDRADLSRDASRSAASSVTGAKALPAGPDNSPAPAEPRDRPRCRAPPGFRLPRRGSRRRLGWRRSPASRSTRVWLHPDQHRGSSPGRF